MENVIKINKTIVYRLVNELKDSLIYCEIYIIESSKTNYSTYLKTPTTKIKIAESGDFERCLFAAKIAKIKLLNCNYKQVYMSNVATW